MLHPPNDVQSSFSRNFDHLSFAESRASIIHKTLIYTIMLVVHDEKRINHLILAYLS